MLTSAWWLYLKSNSYIVPLCLTIQYKQTMHFVKLKYCYKVHVLWHLLLCTNTGLGVFGRCVQERLKTIIVIIIIWWSCSFLMCIVLLNMTYGIFVRMRGIKALLTPYRWSVLQQYMPQPPRLISFERYLTQSKPQYELVKYRWYFQQQSRRIMFY